MLYIIAIVVVILIVCYLDSIRNEKQSSEYQQRIKNEVPDNVDHENLLLVALFCKLAPHSTDPVVLNVYRSGKSRVWFWDEDEQGVMFQFLLGRYRKPENYGLTEEEYSFLRSNHRIGQDGNLWIYGFEGKCTEKTLKQICVMLGKNPTFQIVQTDLGIDVKYKPAVNIPTSEQPINTPKTIEERLELFSEIAFLIMKHIKISMVSILCVQRKGYNFTWSEMNVEDRLGQLTIDSFIQLLRSNQYSEAEISWIKQYTKINEDGHLEISCETETDMVIDPQVLKQIITKVYPETRVLLKKEDDGYAFSIIGIMKENWDEDLSAYKK